MSHIPPLYEQKKRSKPSSFLSNFYSFLLKRLIQRSLPQNSPEKIQLYDAKTIDATPWPKTAEGEYAKKFLTPLIKKGVQAYIDNIHTDMRVLICEEAIFPLTINDAQYDNAYVCSPYSYYISYATQSLDFIKMPLVRKALIKLLKIAGKACRYCQMNKVVMVNNWLLSTNFYPPFDPQKIGAITAFLRKQFPDHAIIFKSIDCQTNPALYQALEKSHFTLLASRQIFLTDTTHSAVFETRLFKSDLRLLKASGYEVKDADQLTEAEQMRLLAFYRELYIQKYSVFNPNLNLQFLQLALENNLLDFKILKKDGCIDGVVGYRHCNRLMTAPFFGYDRTKPKQVGLYRLLSTVLMLEARQRKALFHQSSGASMYKKIRKAQDCIEYTAIYHRHLPYFRKIPWLALKGLYNSLGIWLMRRY